MEQMQTGNEETESHSQEEVGRLVIQQALRGSNKDL